MFLNIDIMAIFLYNLRRTGPSRRKKEESRSDFLSDWVLCSLFRSFLNVVSKVDQDLLQFGGKSYTLLKYTVEQLCLFTLWICFPFFTRKVHMKI